MSEESRRYVHAERSMLVSDLDQWALRATSAPNTESRRAVAQAFKNWIEDPHRWGGLALPAVLNAYEPGVAGSGAVEVHEGLGAFLAAVERLKRLCRG